MYNNQNNQYLAVVCVVVCGYVAGVFVVVLQDTGWPAFFGPRDVGLAAWGLLPTSSCRGFSVVSLVSCEA